MQDNNIEFDDVIMTIGKSTRMLRHCRRLTSIISGSGGTTGGLAIGMALSGISPRTRLHAFCACDNESYFYSEIDQLLNNLGLSDRYKAQVPEI